jgi:DeoR/GlpR family transcriptional regulator of sugar metabolism
LTTQKRQLFILDTLRKEACLRVNEIARTLGVSESTIRNDLNALEKEGRVKRVHGGAVLSEPLQVGNNSFKSRYARNLTSKRAIAVQAAKFVNNGDSILIDASTTGYCFACELSKHEELRVITNGFEVAQELAKNPSNNVILIGGVVNYNTSSVTGLLSEQFIKDLFVQKAFLSCSGFTLERGLTELQLNEAQLKRKVIGSSQQIYALIDSSKFGKEDLTPFLSIEGISALLTDEGISPSWKQKLDQSGIKTIICSNEAEY